MSTMLERAARAARGVVEVERTATTYKDIARAVLMAVRDPDDEMINRAGWSDYDVGGWIEGIDSILAEKA